MNIKDFKNYIESIVGERNIADSVIIDALKEGIEKAFRKHVNCPDALIRLEITDKNEILVHQQKTVVEEVEDDEIEVSLEDAQLIKKDANIGDVMEYDVDISEFGRACVSVVKNIMLQKIKEATKQVIYDEFIDKIDDLVYGTIQTVEEKFVLIDLGKTLGLMLKNEQIPNELYKEGQRIRVVIKDVNKDSKGAQVIVSRASANLVKRLFESTVPEIYDGTVQIKAIAREANERTKMAVYSKNSNVDPIGACIGPRGQRVVAVIDEITMNNRSAVHENIDIVEWSNDFVEYVKNVMKPANVLAVIGNDENKDLLIIVDDAQLSLAIGKRGINARLASKLLGRKVDIKTQSVAEEMGIDWQNEMLAFQAKEQARLKAEEAERIAAEVLAAQKAKEDAETNEIVDETYEPEFVVEEEQEEAVVETAATVEAEAKANEQVKEEANDEKVEEVIKRRKPKLVKASDYVSKFEDLADAKKNEKNEKATNKKKKVNKEDEEDQQIKEKLAELKNKDYEIKPEYTAEELEEFENADDNHWYDDDDVDYDDYNEYYEEN